jgi:hypothetical protein
MAVYENRNRMPPSTSADSGHCHEILRDINIDNVTYQPWQRKYLDRDCDIARDKTLSQVPPFVENCGGLRSHARYSLPVPECTLNLLCLAQVIYYNLVLVPFFEPALFGRSFRKSDDVLEKLCVNGLFIHSPPACSLAFLVSPRSTLS